MAQTQQIGQVQESSGFDIPSDYTDQWFKEIYGETKFNNIIKPIFGCDNGANGEVQDCHEKFSNYVTSSLWVCNTRWALGGVLTVSILEFECFKIRDIVNV